jgi:CheY-like chemotaxis protein
MPIHSTNIRGGDPATRHGFDISVNHPFLAVLVDDDKSVRDYVRILLENEGITVIEAADGIGALKLFDKLGSTVDVLITDVRMPRMNGTELALTVRSECPTIPVIFISSEPANGQLHDPARGLVYVEKPFRPQDILGAVRQVLAQPGKAA